MEPSEFDDAPPPPHTLAHTCTNLRAHTHIYTHTHNCTYAHTHTHLSEGHIVEVPSIERKAELLSYSLNILERIHSRAEDKEDRSGWPGFLVRHLKWYRPLLNIFSPKLLLYIQPT